MQKINRRTVVLIMILTTWILLRPSPALTWEFRMEGQFHWSYEWYNQLGSKGFFGPYNIDNGAGTTTSNLNFWNGGRFDTNITSGADARWTYFYVILEPELKINPAIRLRARYRIGQYGNPTATDYYTQMSPGIDSAIAEGQWTSFWFTAQTPWGIFAVGKRPWKFGNSLQYDGSDSASTESLLLVAPAGPLDIGIGFYPYRYVGRTIPQTAVFGDPYDLIVAPYYSFAEKKGSPFVDLLAFINYSSGPLQAGITGSYSNYHISPDARLRNPLVPDPLPAGAQDSQYSHGSIYTKYNNGRFFFNAETAWLYWTDRYPAPLPPRVPPNPRYVEQWRYMVETGCIAGPMKLSLLYAWSPGPDRRNGAMIGRQSAAFVWHPTFDRHLGNYSVFAPYTQIFGYDYGSGLNAYNLTFNGYVRDARVLAARLDYAMAANLNLFTSFFWAERTANGYGWGCIAPNDPFMPPQFISTPNDGNIQIAINGAAGSPNIPDPGLGYEFDAGFEWMLLDKWSAQFIFAYWQPGKWFNYACIDKSVPAWNIPGPGNSFGVNPAKSIDPVIGGTITLQLVF